MSNTRLLIVALMAILTFASVAIIVTGYLVPGGGATTASLNPGSAPTDIPGSAALAAYAVVGSGAHASDRENRTPIELWSAAEAVDQRHWPEPGPMAQRGTLVKLREPTVVELGDRIILAIPDQSVTAFIGVVESIVDNDVSRSIAGRLEGEDQFFFTVTRGGGLFFAAIGTPEGHFEASGNDHAAWVYPGNAMASMLSRAPPDYRLPEIPGQAAGVEPELTELKPSASRQPNGAAGFGPP